MYPGGNPFGPPPGDPFGPAPGYGQPPAGPPFGAPRRKRNIPALLAALVAVLVLVGAGVWALTRGGGESDDAAVATTTTTATTTESEIDDFTEAPVPSVITSVVTPTTTERVKLDLATVQLGTCVRVQLRSTASQDALDLYKVDCETRDGIYTVTARVDSSDQCNSVYAAAAVDRSFALCLDPY